MSQTMQHRADSNSSYWRSRRHLFYYQYVDSIVAGVAATAQSMIDVGSSNTSIIESFDWVPIRHALDKRSPYSSENVSPIKEDFLEFSPETRYDLAVCLQVLEHVPDAGTFAQKLFEIAEGVLISVPFKWPKGICKYHIHDPVDEEKLGSWTQRKPDYRIVVKEPLMSSPTGRRLIAYYHSPDSAFSLADARASLKKAQGN